MIYLKDLPWVDFCPGTAVFMLKMRYRAVDAMAKDASDFQQSGFQISVCIYITLFALYGAET